MIVKYYVTWDLLVKQKWSATVEADSFEEALKSFRDGDAFDEHLETEYDIETTNEIITEE